MKITVLHTTPIIDAVTIRLAPLRVKGDMGEHATPPSRCLSTESVGA